jgi:hypothetical protein
LPGDTDRHPTSLRQPRLHVTTAPSSEVEPRNNGRVSACARSPKRLDCARLSVL